ncbi:neural cell adhesion molecule 1 isoform X4 [Magallana gigas]
MESRINGRRVTYMLVIRYLTEEDAGDYLCTIRIQGVQWPEWPKKIGKLTVQTAPQIQPSINSIYEKEIGSSLQLTCESHGNPHPNITWKREDGQELPTGGFQSRGATLNLTDIQRNDRGNYICVADNNVKPPDSFKVEVIVFFQPSCRPVQSAVGQAKNRRFNAKLECIVAGYPQPSMKWMKETENGKLIEIDDDDKYDTTKQFSSQLQNDEFWYTLLVKNVQATDYTNYYCVGTNKYGDGETTISLFETRQCQGLLCPYLTAPQIQPNINSIYEKEIGSSLQLTCEAHGNPYPNITWKRENGEELSTGVFQSRLNLTDIQRHDRGNYICEADNNVEPPDTFKVELIVFLKPSCRPVQSMIGQAKNRTFNATLECIVAGYPQPSAKWMKESENGTLTEIDDYDKYDINKQFSSLLQNDEFWYTLLVKYVQATDYTNYYCVGTNKYGEGKTTIVLFETMECQGFNCPYLDEILPEMKQKGETGYLNCTVLKNRYCNVVQWSKARVNETGNPILISEKETIIDQEMLSSEKVGLGKYDVQTLTNENKTSFMLVIRNISEVDAGEYYCTLTPEGQTSYICDQNTGILYVNETLYCQGTNCPSSSGPQMEHFMAFLTLFLLCLKHCIT